MSEKRVTKRSNEPRKEEDDKQYNECPYCGEAVEAPAIYCCEEHEEGRSLR